MTDTLVIDTNVLEYLFDDAAHNADGHIDVLLKAITEKKKRIGLDRPAGTQNSRILAEYGHRLKQHLKQMAEQGLRTQWLRYIVVFAERAEVSVNLSDGLGVCISSAIGHRSKVHAETSDQIFVYVACVLDCEMVSDNSSHITNHSKLLRKCAKGLGSGNTDFISSQAAAAAI